MENEQSHCLIQLNCRIYRVQRWNKSANYETIFHILGFVKRFSCSERRKWVQFIIKYAKKIQKKKLMFHAMCSLKLAFNRNHVICNRLSLSYWNRRWACIKAQDTNLNCCFRSHYCGELPMCYSKCFLSGIISDPFALFFRLHFSSEWETDTFIDIVENVEQSIWVRIRNRGRFGFSSIHLEIDSFPYFICNRNPSERSNEMLIDFFVREFSKLLQCQFIAQYKDKIHSTNGLVVVSVSLDFDLQPCIHLLFR